MVCFGEVRNLQERENVRKDKVQSANKGNCKKWNLEIMESMRDNICKELNL